MNSNYVILVVSLMSVLDSGYALEQKVNETMEVVSNRQARYSTLTDSCTTNDDSLGNCMSRFKCLNSGGVPKGYCSSFGVCCESKFKT